MKRRPFLKLLCAIPLVPVAMGVLSRIAHAGWPSKPFQSDDRSEVMRELFGTDEFADDGMVELKAPEIAENGAVVPITVGGGLAATSVAVIVEKNPLPLAFHAMLGGKAIKPVSSRVKMRESSNIIALVQDVDGKLHGTVKEVKVTIGGCGG